jgi:hypothetical protein
MFSVNIDSYVVIPVIYMSLFFKGLIVYSESVLLSTFLPFLYQWFGTACPFMVLFAFSFCVQNSLDNLF